MAPLDDIRRCRGKVIAQGHHPQIVLMCEDDFESLCTELDLEGWLSQAAVKRLSERAKVYELLGMEIYVSSELDEGEIYIGYLPTVAEIRRRLGK